MEIYVINTNNVEITTNIKCGLFRLDNTSALFVL